MSTIQRYLAFGGVAVILAGAIAAAVHQRDARLRREGEFIAERRAILARADSALQLEKDSAAVRTTRDSVERETLRASLAASVALADTLRGSATEAGARADSATARIAAAATTEEKLTAAMAALAARSLEAMQWRTTAEQERASREIAERGLAQAAARIAEMATQHAADVDLIQDLTEKLRNPLAVPPKLGFFAQLWGVTKYVIVGVGGIAIGVVVSR